MSNKQNQINTLVKIYHDQYETATRKESEALAEQIRALRKEYQEELMEGVTTEGFTSVIVLEKRPGVWQIGGDKDGLHFSVLSPDLDIAKKRWNAGEFDNK
jgi:hypothetical protein